MSGANVSGTSRRAANANGRRVLFHDIRRGSNIRKREHVRAGTRNVARFNRTVFYRDV